MKPLAATLCATLHVPLSPTITEGWTRTLAGEMQTLTAIVAAIEASARTVTLKGPKGNYLDV